MRTGWCLCLFLLVVSASCASPPESVDPPVDLPAAFSESGSGELPERWWREFGDDALTALVEEALDRNLDLRTFWDRLAQFEAIARREGAPRAVQLDATAGASATRTRRPGVTDDATSFDLGLAASYELDVWGRLAARERAAILDARASEEEVRAAAISLSALVAETWYQLVEQRAQRELLEEQIRTNEQVLELIRLRFRQGQFAAADVLRQQQLVESTRADRVQAESRERVLEHQLAVLLGRPPGSAPLADVRVFAELPPLPATGLPAELVERRPDIREAYVRVLAADRRVAEALANRYPRFSLTAPVGTSSARLGDLFDTWFASIAFDLVAPILDGGTRSAEVDRTRALVSERLHEYGAVVLEALREVENALVQERKQRELIESIGRQLELSQSVLDRLRDRYTQGAVNYLDVLQALVSRQSLERTRLTAERQLVEFRIGLCRALAGGWTMERPELERIAARPGDAGEAPEAGSS